MKDIIVDVPPYGQENFNGMYLDQRNTVIGERMASLLGGKVCSIEDSENDRYFLPHAALTKSASEPMGIRTEDDLFGGVVEVASHRDKAILHPRVPGYEQNCIWHSSKFADLVSGAVLPGFSVFSTADAHKALRRLQAEGYTVRGKDPTRDGSGGQWAIKDEAHLSSIMASLPQKQILDHGFVLESNLETLETLSIGQIYFNGKFYSYYGNQESTTSPKGNQTYGGTTLTMMRGPFEDLARFIDDPHLSRAVEQAKTVYRAYSVYDPLISRANFDVVQGQTSNHEFLSGVVDQSLRIGGATPAEIMAIEALQRDPSIEQVTAEVKIRWNPEHPLSLSNGEVVFFDHARKRDIARVLPPAQG
jgi:hypothetical protein